MKRIIECILVAFFVCVSCVRDNGQNRYGNTQGHTNGVQNSGKENNPPKSRDENIVQMKLDGGVYKVPIKINDVQMDFIFDTGASDITMSLVEASYLYKQGKLSDEDIIGVQNYRIADGSISEGMVINLKKVQIADKILYNVDASVVENMSAPLLLGQSALSRFGNIEIDYDHLQIRFK